MWLEAELQLLDAPGVAPAGTELQLLHEGERGPPARGVLVLRLAQSETEVLGGAQDRLLEGVGGDLDAVGVSWVYGTGYVQPRVARHAPVAARERGREGGP